MLPISPKTIKSKENPGNNHKSTCRGEIKTSSSPKPDCCRVYHGNITIENEIKVSPDN